MEIDDDADVEAVLNRSISALRLAGIDDAVLAEHLIAHGIHLQLMEGKPNAKLLAEIEGMIDTLAKHISDKM